MCLMHACLNYRLCNNKGSTDVVIKHKRMMWLRRSDCVQDISKVMNISCQLIQGDTGADDTDLVDYMINQALHYLDQLDWTNGLLSHLNGRPTKEKGSKHYLDRQDWLKIVSNWKLKVLKFGVNLNQPINGSIWHVISTLVQGSREVQLMDVRILAWPIYFFN